MTDEEATAAFIAEQQQSKNDGNDQEGHHTLADEFVSEILKQHGFPKLAAAYDEASRFFWYS